ncbi:hypothetical protein B484DRAFT_462112, partial [Ochromonadaceae sp. CCMP2298]
ADIAAIKRGQVLGGATYWSDEVRLAHGVPEEMSKWMWAGATDWSDEVRLAHGAPEGMSKWVNAGKHGGPVGGAVDRSDEVRLAHGTPEGMSKGEWGGAQTAIAKRAARTPPEDADFRRCNVPGCPEVGWVGLQVVHNSRGPNLTPAHKKRPFGPNYPVATKADWDFQVEAEDEAEQLVQRQHEEHEYSDWTAEDLEDAGL